MPMPNCCHCGRSLTGGGVIAETGFAYCAACESNGVVGPCRICGIPTIGPDRTCQYCSTLMSCRNCGSRLNDNDSLTCYLCERRERVVAGHGYSPNRLRYLVAKGEVRHPDTLFYGVEIEVENELRMEDNESVAASLIRDCRGAVYTKHDGSLSHGFEIVTHPFTWGWLCSSEGKESLAPIWKLKKRGFKAHDTSTAGMHVHMSKEAFTRVQLYRFLQLHYAHPELVRLVSRRQSVGSLNQWAKPTWQQQEARRRINLSTGLSEAVIGDTIASAALNKHRGTDRYHAVNLTNRYTAEVRIFRSTLNPSGFKQRLQWCRAAFDFSRVCSISEAKDVGCFITWLEKNRKQYRQLAKYLLDDCLDQVKGLLGRRVEPDRRASVALKERLKSGSPKVKELAAATRAMFDAERGRAAAAPQINFNDYISDDYDDDDDNQ